MDPSRTARRTIADAYEVNAGKDADEADFKEELVFGVFDLEDDPEQQPRVLVRHTWGDSHAVLHLLMLNKEGDGVGYITQPLQVTNLLGFAQELIDTLQRRDWGTSHDA